MPLAAEYFALGKNAPPECRLVKYLTRGIPGPVRQRFRVPVVRAVSRAEDLLLTKVQQGAAAERFQLYYESSAPGDGFCVNDNAQGSSPNLTPEQAAQALPEDSAKTERRLSLKERVPASADPPGARRIKPYDNCRQHLPPLHRSDARKKVAPKTTWHPFPSALTSSPFLVVYPILRSSILCISRTGKAWPATDFVGSVTRTS
jgi:hypothetical protein